MNCTLSVPTDVECENYNAQNGTQLVEDEYATSPLVTINPLYHAVDEEELHTSFEAAISDRLVALHGRLSRISNPSLSTTGVESITRPLPQGTRVPAAKKMSNKITHSFQFHKSRQFGILLVCFAFFCLLLGFDLMGLLVLFLR